MTLAEVIVEATQIARNNQVTVDIRYYRVGNKRVYYSVLSTDPIEPKHVFAASVKCDGRMSF